MPLLLGVFETPNKVVEVIGHLRDRGYGDLDVFQPSPFPEVENALIDKPSRVRLWTLIGGLAGVTTGFAMTIWMSLDWPIVVGGKELASIPPYVIIGFELTILFGGLLTVAGFALHAGLPHGKFGKNDVGYSARFSAEDFGLTVRCKERDVVEVDALLRAFNAKEVSLVEP